MTSLEKLCLQWNEYQNIFIKAFRDLRNDEALTDVTLVCEDGKQIKAHKVVLASTSPFFLDLLKRNKHPHPLVYMKGIKSENIFALVDFLYRGEANVFEENLDSFLELAEEMRLLGLSGKVEETVKKYQSIKTQENTQTPSNHQFKSELEIPHHSQQISAMSNSMEITDMQLRDEQIKSMMENGENRAPVKRGNGRIGEETTKVCKVCGKEGLATNIKQHIEAKHISGIMQTCDFCEQKFKTRESLRFHKSRYHRKEL